MRVLALALALVAASGARTGFSSKLDINQKVYIENQKLRRQKLVEEADARMAADLFSGVDRAESAIEEEKAKEAEKARIEAEKAAKKEAKKAKVEVRDAFDKVQLNTQADVESLLATCMEKMEKAKAKGAAQPFLTHLMKAVEAQLTSEELNNFDKRLGVIVKDKKVEKTAVDVGKRKTNEKLSKTTKFDIGKETADVYGDGDWGDDWDEEWWDDATAKEYAPPTR